MKRSRSLRVHLFLNYSLIIIVVFLLFAFVFSAYMVRYIRQTATTETENLSISLMESIDGEIEKMDNVSMNVLYSLSLIHI